MTARPRIFAAGRGKGCFRTTGGFFVLDNRPGKVYINPIKLRMGPAENRGETGQGEIPSVLCRRS